MSDGARISASLKKWVDLRWTLLFLGALLMALLNIDRNFPDQTSISTLQFENAKLPNKLKVGNSTLNRLTIEVGIQAAAAAFAMVVQVLSLMWLRTVVNYQYRNGC